MDYPPPAPRQRQSQPNLLGELEAEVVNPNEIVTEAPAEQFRLGHLDVICLILNRIIGTGIFNSPHRVMLGTQSAGASLLFWFAGILYALSGAHVYVEYGLNVPRYVIDGVEQTVPRSGGDLHYLQYVYRKPRYKKDTVLYFACLYGIAFICLGNMAGNSVSFAIRVLQASHPGTSASEVDGPTVRGIAIAVATATCFIHAISRRGGILLNNVLALIKVGILLLIIVTSIVVAAGGFKDDAGAVVKSVIGENTSGSNAFRDASSEANGYAHAFLAIIFAFSGFDQPNHVLGEIGRPRKTYPVSMLAGISIVCSLYMAVNVCYMVVVPRESQIDGNVAQAFFERTFGLLGSNNTGERVLNAFLAISSLGNIIVMTYTASRMKQEIAKEGFLPFAKFFAQDADFSVGRLLRWFQDRGWFTSLLRHRWFSPEAHSEKTPVGALVLHFVSCMVILSATSRLEPDDAYDVLSVSTAYLFPAFFGMFLALGILILRFGTPPETAPVQTPLHPALGGGGGGGKSARTWTQMTAGTVSPALSVTCAVIYFLGNAYPVVTTWIPPLGALEDPRVRWFVVPVISCGALALATVWFLGFLARAKRREKRRHQEFVVERYPEFDQQDELGATRATADFEASSERGCRICALVARLTLHFEPALDGRDSIVFTVDGHSQATLFLSWSSPAPGSSLTSRGEAVEPVYARPTSLSPAPCDCRTTTFSWASVEDEVIYHTAEIWEVITIINGGLYVFRTSYLKPPCLLALGKMEALTRNIVGLQNYM